MPASPQVSGRLRAQQRKAIMQKRQSIVTGCACVFLSMPSTTSAFVDSFVDETEQVAVVVGPIPGRGYRVFPGRDTQPDVAVCQKPLISGQQNPVRPVG